MFKGSESVDHPDEVYQENKEITKDARTNRQTFKNKRAQYYWKLRDRFHNTYRAVEKGEYIDPDEMISLSSDIENIEQLRSEVCRIPRKKVPSGLIQIMSKDDMWSIHKIPSPNRADSMMMAMISADLAETVDLTFESEF
jgi:phage terminase large subunit